MTGTFQSNYLMTYLSKLSLARVRIEYTFGCLEAPCIYYAGFVEQYITKNEVESKRKLPQDIFFLSVLHFSQ